MCCPLLNKTGIVPFYSIVSNKLPRRSGRSADIGKPKDAAPHAPGI